MGVTLFEGMPVRKSRKPAPKEVREAAGRVVQAFSRYCRDHHVPTPNRMDLAIFSQQVTNLVKGGYGEQAIRDEALNIAGEYTLRYGHKGMTQLQRRVQQNALDSAEKEHIVRMAEEKETPVDPNVVKVIAPLKKVPTLPKVDDE